MDFIEFDTHLSKDGKIPVPVEYVDDLAHKEIFHVTVTTPADIVDHARHPRSEGEDAIDYYLENPIIIPGVKAPSRDEIYEGH